MIQILETAFFRYPISYRSGPKASVLTASWGLRVRVSARKHQMWPGFASQAKTLVSLARPCHWPAWISPFSKSLPSIHLFEKDQVLLGSPKATTT